MRGEEGNGASDAAQGSPPVGETVAEAEPTDRGTPTAPQVRTFLIADIRGYTVYTREFGDQAAATLASRFAEIAAAAMQHHDGRLVELRGDEALAVFDSARQALRAALELQEAVRQAELPRGVGIGIDSGEAVPVDDGFRGSALNLAARLCSHAAAGEILASEAVVHVAAKLDGVAYSDPRALILKGFDEPIKAVRVVPEDQLPHGIARTIRRIGRRHRRLVSLVGGAVVALVLTAVFVGRSGESSPTSTTPRSPAPPARLNGVVAIDPTTREVTASVPLPGRPAGIAFGEGSVWVSDEGGSVSRIDPASHTVRTIKVGASPRSIAIGAAPYGWRTTTTARSRGSTPRRTRSRAPWTSAWGEA